LPRSRFAAGLAGLNLVSGTLAGHGLLAGDLEIYGQHDELPGQLPAGEPGVAVFPPSAVSVFLTEAHGSPRNSFAVTVTDLEPHGDRIRVRAGQGGQLSADVTPEAAADLGLVPGMLVYFVVKAAAVSIYPA
jgi:molybdate transport system ATP-binding protein